MKFIKRFNESNEESIQDIIDDIKDICLDITDGRFRVSFMNTQSTISDKHGNAQVMTLIITLTDVRDYDGFTLSEVEEVIQRIYDYLTIRRFMGCSVLKVGEIHRSAMKYITHDDRMSNIAIHFKE